MTGAEGGRERGERGREKYREEVKGNGERERGAGG